MKNTKKIFIENPNKLRNILIGGGVALSIGFVGFGIGVVSSSKEDNKENSNSETTTKIIETTEKPIETEETIAQTIEEIMSAETSTVTTVPAVEEQEEITTTPIICDDAVIYANETTTTVATTEPVVTTTKEEITTTAPIVTTLAQTTKAPVVTTAAPVQTTVTTSQVQEYAYKDIDLARFEELTQNLVDEFSRLGLVKAKGKKYTKEDLYSIVYACNCDDIDEDVKQELIDKNYLADDSASVFVDAASSRDVVMTDTGTKSILNTNIDEIYFGLNYFKDDEDVFYQMFDDEAQYDIYDYNSTNKVRNRITEKLKTLDMDEYYEARNQYYGNLKRKINMPVCKFIANSDNAPKEFIGRNSYQLEDFVDISVAINDPEAKKNVQQTLKLIVDASLDNSKAVNSLNSFSNFYMGDKQHTSLTDCGAGATFAMNIYIYAYSDFLAKNPFKTLQGFAKDEEQYEQMKIRYNRIVNDSQELNDVVRIFDSCSKQLTK